MEKKIASRFGPVALFRLVAALLAVLAGNTVAGAQGDPLSILDHFKCYRVTQGTPANAFVQLQDQFDKLDGNVEDVVVQNPLLFCNPVNKILGRQVTSIVNENNHLKMYFIAPTLTQTRAVDVTNQFTGSALKRLDVFQPVILAVPTQKRPHGPPERLDHFKCYLVRGEPVNIQQLGLVDQFDKEQVSVGRPVLLCNPTVKIHGSTIGAAGDLGDNVTPITNEDAHLVCYRIISPSLTPTISSLAATPRERAVQVLNQFDKEIIKVAEPILLCVPSGKIVRTTG